MAGLTLLLACTPPGLRGGVGEPAPGTAPGQEDWPELAPLVARPWGLAWSAHHEDPQLRTMADHATIPGGPAARLDEALKGHAGFRLFRRAGSRAGHPTTQGATFRQLAPSGAGRALVLLDGIPINDPFGGWVAWSLLPTESGARVEMFPQGGVSPWGWGSLGGVLSVGTGGPVPGKGQTTLHLATGEPDRASLFAAVSGGPESLAGSLDAHRFVSSGHWLLDPADRGPVDRRSDLESWRVHGRADGRTGSLRWSARLLAFAEERLNGTALTPNGHSGLDAGLRLQAPGMTAGEWELILFTQERDFHSQFTSVNAGRDFELPVLDQYEVPARSWGGMWRWPELWSGNHAALGLAVDFRRVEGRVGERFRNLGAGFTRDRQAGGVQEQAGLALRAQGELPAGWSWEWGGRINRWRDAEGFRREFDQSNGARLLEEQPPEQTDWVGEARAGLRWNGGPARGRWFLEAYRGGRAPTLNERYRPFRVGNDITEANPFLEPETIHGLSFGWNTPEESAWQGRAEIYYQWLEDAVVNVTRVTGPANVPPWGFIPAGGVGRRRENVERLEAAGVEWEARRSLGRGLWLEGALQTGWAEVRASALDPDLEGNRPPQTPRWSWRLGLGGGTDPLSWTVEGRGEGQVFEADANTRVLAPARVLSASLSGALPGGWSWFLRGENLLDSQIESAVSGEGLVSLGSPRTLQAAVRWSR